ncbi:MAG: hypothetical protein NTW28_34850, partial [Candidatus Solibacter sp.]|nr:hypothetical protein [Candidatus Solibacter sp.]
ILVFGFKLVRSLEMAQVTRDLGAMYLRGVDFRTVGSQQTARTLAESFNMTATGTSVAILSKVKLVTTADCIAANAVAPIVAGSACANQGRLVFTEQLKVGNPASGASGFGAPPVQAAGCTPIAAGVPCVYTVTIKDQGRNTLAQASNFVMVLNAGEFAYVAEMVNQTPALDIPGLSGGPQVYARAIF